MVIVFYYKMLPSTGTSQGLKLTLNVETDEYMSGPASGTGAFVSTKLFIVNGTKICRWSFRRISSNFMLPSN